MAVSVQMVNALNDAKDRCAEFIAAASASSDAREAADWALAAKNMAAAVHSLTGAAVTESRSR